MKIKFSAYITTENIINLSRDLSKADGYALDEFPDDLVIVPRIFQSAHPPYKTEWVLDDEAKIVDLEHPSFPDILTWQGVDPAHCRMVSWKNWPHEGAATISAIQAENGEWEIEYFQDTEKWVSDFLKIFLNAATPDSVEIG